MIGELTYRCIKRDGQIIEEKKNHLKECRLLFAIGDKKIETICTEQYIDELMEGHTFVEQQTIDMLSPITYKDSWIFIMADRMEEGMPLHEETWGTHSAFLFRKGELLFACEDIGRHNAIDKVIGYALKNEINLTVCAIYSSGRAPSDMVEKIIRAGVPVFVTKGVPTSEAVELAKKYHLTLICGARRDQMKIYSDFRRKEVDALILAGGKSTRMGGAHKGSLKIGEETFTQHLVNELSKVAGNIWLSYGSDIHEQYVGCQIVTDTYKECGPMGGIHAGLAASKAEYVFVVACDMPFMKAEFVERLLTYLSDDVEIVVPVVAGRIQPLASIYKKSVLPMITELLEQKQFKIRSIFDQVNTMFIELEEKELADMLRNINTMEEYKEI